MIAANASYSGSVRAQMVPARPLSSGLQVSRRPMATDDADRTVGCERAGFSSGAIGEASKPHRRLDLLKSDPLAVHSTQPAQRCGNQPKLSAQEDEEIANRGDGASAPTVQSDRPGYADRSISVEAT